MRNITVELSIVIPTLGRNKQVQDLLESIVQTIIPGSFEILIIDQNSNDCLNNIIQSYSDKLPLIHHKVSFKGLSKARNFGVKHANGHFVCFPDDDAEFEKNTISTALQLLKNSSYDMVFGKCIDKETKKDSIIQYGKQECLLTLNHFEGLFVEATMFAVKNIFDAYQFDENMGVGCLAGSQEGYDLVYRLLQAGKKLYYSPHILFYHPNKIAGRNSVQELHRAFYYSWGLGYLCKKHSFKGKYYLRFLKLLVGIPAICICRNSQLNYYIAQLCGLWIGYHFGIKHM